METDICLEGHEGSPLESKKIASTKAWKPSDIIKANSITMESDPVVQEMQMFNVGEEDGEAAAYVNISLALIDEGTGERVPGQEEKDHD